MTCEHEEANGPQAMDGLICQFHMCNVQEGRMNSSPWLVRLVGGFALHTYNRSWFDSWSQTARKLLLVTLLVSAQMDNLRPEQKGN